MSRARLHVLRPALAMALLAPLLAAAQHSELGTCGNLRNAYGPYDYRTDRRELVIVEAYHFSAAVEQLIRGTTGSIGGDLDYTLRAYPNHHRALNAISRYGEKLHSDYVPGAPYSVECYFIRAVNHRADDTTVRMLYANYLKGRNRLADALQQLAYASKIAGENGFTHFNLGLMYLELGDPAAALQEAHIAMSLGFTRPELKQKLQAIDSWEEPPPATTAAATGAASAPR